MNGFDKIISVDWSAANQRTCGHNSIWIASLTKNGMECWNPTTRAEAMNLLMLETRATAGRVLIGFDFSFGYPIGFLDAMGLEDWKQLWRFFSDELEDDVDNVNNRFEFASGLNKRLGFAEGPFWGQPQSHVYSQLGPKKPKTSRFAELRRTEINAKGAQSVWKLAYAGSVGSQTLTGIARLWKFRELLREERPVTVWPFEALAKVDDEVVIVELYHSIFQFDRSDTIPDRAQVIASANMMADATLKDWFAVSDRFPEAKEEGWTFGILR